MDSYDIPNANRFEFFLSKSGLVQLFHSNRKYRLVSELKSGMTSWRCTYKKCTASILFDGSAIIRCRGNHVCREVSSKDEVNSPMTEKGKSGRKNARKPRRRTNTFVNNGDAEIFAEEYSSSFLHLLAQPEEENFSLPTEVEENYFGNKKLCCGGYMYTRKYVKSNRIRWECSKRRSLGCKGAATSNLSNEDIRESVLHNHRPDNMSVEIEKLKARMKDRIKSSGARPSQVLVDVLHSSADLIAEMGKIESLKRNLRRQKKQTTNIICEPDTLNFEDYDLFNEAASDNSEVPQSGGGGQVVQSPGSGSPGPAPVPVVKKASTAQPPPPAAPPEVCLRWNSYHSNMQATFPSLLNNEQFVDVTLACEGRSIKCHKVMLSACSSYFEELLSQNPCQHPIIFMRDLKFWEVQALVEFMYTGEVNVAQDKLPSLLTAAEALQIKGLTNPSSSGGGSTGSYAASQEDDSNTTPDIDDVSSPSYCPPAKKVRKRKATNPTSYHQKAQAVYSPVTQQGSPISSPMLHQVTAPPALTPMRMMCQPTLGIVPQIASHPAPAAHSTTQPPAAHPGTQPAAAQPRPSLPRLKKDPGSPQHSYLPPPHPPFTPIIKSEPDDNMDTLLDLSESENRKESNANLSPEEPLSLATNDQGPGSNGSQTKAQDNGISEEDTNSDCSESQGMHIDPGETSDA